MTEEQKADMSAENDRDTRIYEVSFHIVPNLDEAAVAAEANDIRKSIESKGASILGEHPPLSMALAYPIQKSIHRTRHTFTRGFFGWFVFEGDPEAAHALKSELGGRDHIVRLLMIKTTREAAAPRKHPSQISHVRPTETPHAPAAAPVAEKEKSPMNVAQVDAEIEKLVVE